jgi:isochorismate synthase
MAALAAQRKDLAARNRTWVLTWPIDPVIDHSATGLLLDASWKSAFSWEPPSGPRMIGLGRARSIAEIEKPSVLTRRAESLLAAVEQIRHPSVGSLCPPPRMLGAIAFDPRRSDEVWSSFEGTSFEIPRWTIAFSQSAAHLSLALTPDDLDDRGDLMAIAELDRIEAALRAPRVVDRARPSAGRMERTKTSPSFDGWSSLIDLVSRRIASGSERKIVLARRTTIVSSETIDPRVVLERLPGGDPHTARFFMRRRSSCFLGASPERLVAKRGRSVATEALAGTIARGAPLARLDTEKERTEQAIVVDDIARKLRALGARVDHPEQPALKALSNVTHLHTRIEAELERPAHILDLVDALHPTPATSGSPSDEARAFICAHEPFARGLYAGPIGWFDAAGDGELFVALRCGLIEGRSAHAFAGAGIVAGSDAASEYQEAALKESVFLRALGVEA